MSSDFTALLGMQLDDVATSDFVQPLMAGSKTDLVDSRFHLQLPLHGMEFVADFDGRVSTVFFHSGRAKDYRKFPGPLPEGLCFGDSKRFVHQRLGHPSANGGGMMIPFFGRAPKWDRYDREGFSLHIQYCDSETSISLVSLIRPDSVAR